jgi:hypothetical protein
LQDDLAALRAHLGPFIEYLEADLKVFSTIRGLTNSQEQGNSGAVTGGVCANCESWPNITAPHADDNAYKSAGADGEVKAASVSSW